MAIRKSSVFLAGTACLILLLAALAVHSVYARTAATSELSRNAELVQDLQLTDLCLFTEASYTRNLATTDLNTPFQDAPFSFEHFPSGALAGPPAHLVRFHVRRN